MRRLREWWDDFCHEWGATLLYLMGGVMIVVIIFMTVREARASDTRYQPDFAIPAYGVDDARNVLRDHKFEGVENLICAPTRGSCQDARWAVRDAATEGHVGCYFWVGDYDGTFNCHVCTGDFTGRGEPSENPHVPQWCGTGR